MKLRFAKMQGQGNDFVVLDGVRQEVALDGNTVRALADRHFGVGCDQVLVVEKPASGANDFLYRIYNADGDEVEQCGNGARCFARFVLDEGLTTKREIAVETKSGVIRPKIEDSGQVTVDMGVPRFDPRDVPRGRASASGLSEIRGPDAPSGVGAPGNLHAVQLVEDVERAPVHQGPPLSAPSAFPKRAVGYPQPTLAHARAWERGAGETLSRAAPAPVPPS
jgi:diaminopimelate epimerase